MGVKSKDKSGEAHIPITDDADIDEDVQTSDKQVETDLLYSVTDIPPWYECIFLGFQHFLSIYVATLVIPTLIAPSACFGSNQVAKNELFGAMVFVGGLVSVFQVLFGCRLPIIQGGTYALMNPTLAYLGLKGCPPIMDSCENFTMSALSNSSTTCIEDGSPEHEELWKGRIAEIQGSLMIACLMEILLGYTGLVGKLLRFMGPLSIAPTIGLLGLALFKSAAERGEGQWWICILTVVLMVLFSQYLSNVQIPCIGYSRITGWHKVGYPLFKMFPVILAMVISWLVCFILTETDTLPDDPNEWGYMARTDIQNEAFTNSPWFKFPYPGQWGMPTVSLSLILALWAGLIASMVESIGDYIACARLAGVPPPTTAAINRGIGTEGLGCLIAGAFGTGNGTTSSSVNVGVLGVTKVGSRVVMFYVAFIMMFFGVFTKFGILFITIPDPVIGGAFFIFFAMITAVGMSNLQYVDMNSTRNLFITGFSFFCGLCIPEWVGANKESIDTGVEELDNIFVVLLSTHNFVGGVIAFFLDNTIPGTPEQRGLMNAKYSAGKSQANAKEVREIYDFPFGMDTIRKTSWTRYLPFCPNYGETDLPDSDSLVSNEKELEVIETNDYMLSKDSVSNGNTLQSADLTKL